MKIPSYPRKGKPVEDTVRGLIDYVRAITVTGFVGGRVVQNSNGTTIVAAKKKPVRPGGFNHPFKITQATNTDLLIEFGVVYFLIVKPDVTPSNYATLMPVSSFVVGSGGLNGGPEGLTGGGIGTLPSKTYGIWMQIDWSSATHADPVGQFKTWQLASFEANQIISSETYVDPADYDNIMASSSGASYIYIGKVTTDADGIATIKQYLRSDLTIPAVSLPITILSTDANQSLGLGTDGGIYYDEP